MINKLIYSGFLVGAAFLLLVALKLLEVEVASLGFMVGFYLGAAGIISAILSMDARQEPSIIGLKIAAIGFGFSCSGFLIDYFQFSPSLKEFTSDIGKIMSLLGILVAIIFQRIR